MAMVDLPYIMGDLPDTMGNLPDTMGDLPDTMSDHPDTQDVFDGFVYQWSQLSLFMDKIEGTQACVPFQCH